MANNWVQLLKLLNKVSDLGLVLQLVASGGAYKKRGHIWFRRGYRAVGMDWSSSVV
jgi:hypothetical protein